MSSELIERLQSQYHMTQGDGLTAMLDTAKEAAATIVQLQAELAEAREVPGRIAAWFDADATIMFCEGVDGDFSESEFRWAASIVKARDWSKP